MSAVTPRLVFHGTRNDWGIRIDNPKAVADVIGVDLLASLYKCFVGIDRLTTFEHLIYISQVDYAKRNGGRDTPSAERNMHVLFLLMAGTLHELGDALQQLTSAKAALKIKDKGVWGPVNELRKRWHKDPYASQIRNGFSHHLGELDTFKQGIAASPDQVELMHGQTSLRHGARFVEPWNALMRAEKIEDEEFDAFVKKTQEAHDKLPEHMVRLFTELLSSNGIDVVDERRD
jgi:hypothetical protein